MRAWCCDGGFMARLRGGMRDWRVRYRVVEDSSTDLKLREARARFAGACRVFVCGVWRLSFDGFEPRSIMQGSKCGCHSAGIHPHETATNSNITDRLGDVRHVIGL